VVEAAAYLLANAALAASVAHPAVLRSIWVQPSEQVGRVVRGEPHHDDPSFRDSAESYFVQVADLVAFLHFQEIAPSQHMRRTGGQAYFRRLTPVLLRAASGSDPRGIVRL